MSEKSWSVRAMPIFRWVAFGGLLTFSVVVVGASAHYITIQTTQELFVDEIQVWPQTSPDPFAAYDLAVGVLTPIFLLPMLIVDICRRGAFTSFVITEISVLGAFLVFWLAAAGWTTAVFPPVEELCQNNPQVGVLNAACTDIQLEMAFGWLAWILLLAYWVTLLTLAIMSSQKGPGMSAWKKAVRDTDFGLGGNDTAGSALNMNNRAPSDMYRAPGVASASQEQFLAKSQEARYQRQAQPGVYNPNVPYDPPSQTMQVQQQQNSMYAGAGGYGGPQPGYGGVPQV
ncbi:hypothetical protein BDW22DRAFT_1356383 [Trametopsis cervina]|nr:hypothetical protein BDW22DRAFT_1356383 [Trametopsis cervina]